MSEKDVTKFLQILGLSKREIQVYMFLAKSGVQSTSFVAKRLKMERVQAYRTFKKLQETITLIVQVEYDKKADALYI